jgi:NAD(P)-dependent dehydrogenase (short-subunit alcohol dehydrogenase family)
MPLPMLIYTASKAAINAFTESLALELEPFGVCVRLVLPGRSPETPFGQNAQSRAADHGLDVPDAYVDFAQGIRTRMAQEDPGPLTHATDVAEVICQAVCYVKRASVMRSSLSSLWRRSS